MNTQHVITRLNAAAAHYNEASGMAPIEAMEQAVRDENLELVAEDGQCRIYGMSTVPDINDKPQWAYLVNCWLEGLAGGELVDGGAGFDDNIEWYTERQ